MNKRIYWLSTVLSVFLSFFLDNPQAIASEASKNLKFKITFPDSVHAKPITGRAYIILTQNNFSEPRWQVGWWGKSAPFFGIDVNNMKPGETVIIDENVLGFPNKSLRDLAAGKYYIQGLMNVYTQFNRADGHVIWVHMDQWEGQQFNRTPGNLISSVDSLYLDPKQEYSVQISLNQVIPPLKEANDTDFIKNIKIKSKILSEFWGKPMYLGATILLPKGYASYPDIYYPVLYQQGHFSRNAFGHFKEQSKFYQFWTADDFPRMIIVNILHPCPYFDDSYAVNSENCGPYGDAIMNELIPYIENQFRIIRKPYARILYGGSTGGWIALALQVFHPDFYGGTWSFYPDPVDFRFFQLINIYEDENAYYYQYNWANPERPAMRDTHGQPLITVRQFSQMESVLGSRGRSGQQSDAFQAVFGPVGEDGYPKPLWDKETGKIDSTVAKFYKEHYDLRYYLETNWSWLGAKLVGKLHFVCGDMDTYYLNEALYELENFLEGTTEPYYQGSFNWGRPRKGHGWTPWDYSSGEFYRLIAEYIIKNTPDEE